MQEHQSVNIRQISQNRAEQVAYYRFLSNENVTLSELIRSLSDHCQLQVNGLHVLAISDTSEINLQAHAGRLKPDGLGVVGNNRDIGFFLHPTLALNAETGFPIGLSTVQLWKRKQNRADKHQRQYPKLPIEEKESYKWLRSAQQSQPCFAAGGARLVTHIGDREGDIYEEFVEVPDEQTHVLVRSYQNRRLWRQEESLYPYLAQQPCEGVYTVPVTADPRRKTVRREAVLEVRFTRVRIQRPHKASAKEYPPYVSLFALEAREIDPPKGTDPVHWRLLTTHEITNFEAALQILQWYCWRWRIEQLFAALKRAGLNLEATQLESVAAIERLSILALSVALRALQLVEGRENTDLPAAMAFDPTQQQCLERLAPSLQGRTRRQQNPYPSGSLPWATWLVARLGGWSGYSSQRPPGISTLVRGLRRLDGILLGWNLSQTPLVCTP